MSGGVESFFWALAGLYDVSQNCSFVLSSLASSSDGSRCSKLQSISSEWGLTSLVKVHVFLMLQSTRNHIDSRNMYCICARVSESFNLELTLYGMDVCSA